MAIDPVVVLIYELRAAQQALARTRGDAGVMHDPAQRKNIASLEETIADLRGQLLRTTPNGPVGASELIQIAANILSATHAPYADQLQRIAARLAIGRRITSDILWLRQMADAVTDGLCGEQGDAARLLQSAVKGATAPIIVYRAVDAPPKAVNGFWDHNGDPL